MKFDNTNVFNFEGALFGMRNPLESWAKSDSDFQAGYNHRGTVLGKNDLDLAQRLIKAGGEHRKFMRQIFISVDITAPLYWFKEFDTYKVGTVANSTSFMHKGLSKEFDIRDFETDLHIDTLLRNANNGHEVPIDDIDEQWKDIVYYENLYKISNKGTIIRKEFSIYDNKGVKRTYPEKKLAISINLFPSI